MENSNFTFCYFDQRMRRSPEAEPLPWGPYFIDGIDFVCKCAPVKNIELPPEVACVSIHHSQLEHFDFDFETNVLNNLIKKDQSVKSTHHVAKPTEKTPCTPRNSPRSRSGSPLYPNPDPQIPSSFSSEVLIPTKAKDKGSSAQSSNNSNGIRTQTDPTFLSDFEQASDPFDSVQLKTINDIEELRSVLQSSDISSQQRPCELSSMSDSRIPAISDIHFPK